jgi:hypothetical protein
MLMGLKQRGDQRARLAIITASLGKVAFAILAALPAQGLDKDLAQAAARVFGFGPDAGSAVTHVAHTLDAPLPVGLRKGIRFAQVEPFSS